MKNACRGILVSSCLILALGGCARFGNATVGTWTECTPGNGAGVDWASAPVRTLTWKDSSISPAIIRMKPHTAYTLRLQNNEAYGKTFQAYELFRETQIVSVGGAVPDGHCVEQVAVASGNALDIQLITGDENSYDFGVFFPMDFVRVVGVESGWPVGTGSGVVSVR